MPVKPKQIGDWTKEAQKRGFKSAKEWLTTSYDSGLSVVEMGKLTGLSRAGAHKLLKRFGVEFRSRGGPNRAGR